jgi:hypothetical protein
MNRYLHTHARVLILAAIALSVTVAEIVVALYPRSIDTYPPLAPAQWFRLPSSFWDVGDALAGLTVPVGLFYFISISGPFRRHISGIATRFDRLVLFTAFATMHLLTIVWVLSQQVWHVAFIAIPLIAAAYFTSWPLGMLLGVATMFIVGTRNYFDYGVADIALPSPFEDGLAAAWRSWADIFVWYYVFDQEASVYIWIGIVTGMLGQWLGPRRYSPVIGPGTGIMVMLATTCLIALNQYDASWIIESAASLVIASGVAMVFMVLMVRTILGAIAEQRAQSVETARVRSELMALRVQINPHFFFNTLNTIRYFVRSDPAQARRLLLDLSEIFQRAIRSGEFVSLQDELRYVEAYLRLESARLGDRLQSEIRQADDVVPDMLVPTLISQPIVENAVLHGIAKRNEGGKVTVSVERSGGDLLIRVEDNGEGMDEARVRESLAAGGNQSSIGLRNVDSRLRALYGQEYGLAIRSTKGAGTAVTIRIPIANG